MYKNLKTGFWVLLLVLVLSTSIAFAKKPKYTEVEVVDGKLVIEFDKLASLSTYLTAIIIEPVDEPSNFDLQGEVEEHYQRDQESLVSSNAKIEEQIGALLSEIATAAGPQQLAEALGIDTTAVELDTTTSPN